MNLSLDGYIAAPGDDLGWSVPSDEGIVIRGGMTHLSLLGE
jgi:hypothetical protein